MHIKSYTSEDIYTNKASSELHSGSDFCFSHPTSHLHCLYIRGSTRLGSTVRQTQAPLALSAVHSLVRVVRRFNVTYTHTIRGHLSNIHSTDSGNKKGKHEIDPPPVWAQKSVSR